MAAWQFPTGHGDDCVCQHALKLFSMVLSVFVIIERYPEWLGNSLLRTHSW